MKKILQILILLSIVEIGVVFAYSEPVGVVDLNNSMILTWNQGRIANETYFNKSTGLLQHANTIERSDDVTYIYGIARNVSGTMAYWGMESNPGGTITNKTDFSTYYWLNNRIVRTNGPGQFTLDKNHSQNLNDDHVTISFVASANRDYSGEFYVSHGFRNLDINNDKVSETFNFVHGNGSLETWDNRSGDFWFDNVTRIVIDGGVGSYSYDLNFSLGVKMRINHSSPSTNPDITFYSFIGNIVRDQVYKYEYKWIDAVCSISCSGLGSVVVTDELSFDEILEFETKERRCKYYILRPDRTSNCSISNDCNLQIDRNLTSVAWTVITSTANAPLRCANQTSCVKQANIIPQNTYYTFNLSGYMPVPQTDVKTTMTRCSISGQIPDFEFEVFTYLLKINVTLWTPANNTQINNTVPWSVFGCNWTGPSPNTMSLLFNGSSNYTTGGNPASNISQNVTFDFYSCLNWTCQGCKFGHCHDAWNGPRLFCQVMLGAVSGWVPNPNVSTEFIVFRDEPKKDHIENVPNWAIYGIAGIIILMGLSATIITHHQNKRRDDAERYSNEP